MRFILELSLEKIALVKIGSTLWNQSDIRTFIIKERLYKTEKNWRSVEEDIIKKVEKLPQPHLLKEKITGYVRLMGLQILKWIKNHAKMIVLPPAYFVWTSYGTIDYKETARLIIQDQTVNPVSRYQLAFFYCLEGDIQMLFDSISEEYKGLIPVHDPMVINVQNLADVWTSDSPNRCFWNFPVAGTGSFETSFQNAVELTNKVAVEYFLEKLTLAERKVCLAKAIQASTNAEVLCFLLSHMDEEQRKWALRNNSNWIMMHILQWPWLSFFVEAATLYWDSKNEKLTSPLTILTSQVLCGNIDLLENDIYRQLFKELWQGACSRFGADVCAEPQLLSNLFVIKDREIIGLIFRDMSPTIKKDFIWSTDGLSISEKLVSENELDLLEFFIQQCLTLEHDITQYRRKFHLS